MTPGWMLDSDCIHGNVWYECDECEAISRLEMVVGVPLDFLNDGEPQ